MFSYQDHRFFERTIIKISRVICHHLLKLRSVFVSYFLTTYFISYSLNHHQEGSQLNLKFSLTAQTSSSSFPSFSKFVVFHFFLVHHVVYCRVVLNLDTFFIVSFRSLKCCVVFFFCMIPHYHHCCCSTIALMLTLQGPRAALICFELRDSVHEYEPTTFARCCRIDF